jgi:predicted transcriptional regulator
MKKHNGMRPHDIVILLKLVTKGDQPWRMKDLSYELDISASEISESLNRSVIAGLISQNKKTVQKSALLDFLEYGLRYVYPQQPGSLTRGIPTAHSAAPISQSIVSENPYIWPYKEGSVRGEALVPLHPKVPEACLRDPLFYEYMSLCEALRVGKARERSLAMDELKSRLK